MTGQTVVEPASTRSPAVPPPPTAAVRLAVVACTGLALGLGFWHLQHRSLSHDEAFTWSTVDRGFPALISVLFRFEGYQILHSLIEWPVNRISSTVDALRTPSVIAFAAAVPAVWLTARRLFDDRTGLLAALLFALNGFALDYAQNARGYLLATALCAYSGAMLAGYVLAPRRFTRVAWIVCGTLAIYAHGFAVLGVGAQVASMWFLPAARRRELHWIRNGLLIALCAAPAILAPLFQVSSTGLGVVSRPGVNDLRGLVWSMAGRTWTSIPSIGVGVLVALFVAVGHGRRELHSIDSFRFALPILWMIVPSLLLLSASYVHPVWLERYVLWSVVAVVILAAYGLNQIGRHNVAVMCVVVVLAVGLATRGVVKWYREPADQDYRSAMGELAPRIRAGDAFIFTPDEVRISSEFYLRSETDLSKVIPVFPAKPWGHFKTGDQHIDPVGQDVIGKLIARRAPRVWVVSYGSPPGVTAPRINELRVAYRVVSDREYQGVVDVMLLEAR